MDFLVGNLTQNKCDAILCPPGTSSPVGRQINVEMPCQPCSGETKEKRELQAPYYGMFACKSISEERSILEELYGLIFNGKLTIWREFERIRTVLGKTSSMILPLSPQMNLLTQTG
jgi:hypothetical protein